MNTLRPKKLTPQTDRTRPNRMKRCPGGQMIPRGQMCPVKRTPRLAPRTPRTNYRDTKSQQFKNRYAR